jgi:hypothetical protein
MKKARMEAKKRHSRTRFLGGEVNVSLENSDKNALIPTTGFNK